MDRRASTSTSYVSKLSFPNNHSSVGRKNFNTDFQLFIVIVLNKSFLEDALVPDSNIMVKVGFTIVRLVPVQWITAIRLESEVDSQLVFCFDTHLS